MIHLNIVIKPLDDKEPAFAHINDENFIGESKLEAVSILEHGMSSGKTSLGLLIKLPDGKYTLAQTSADLMSFIWHTLQGAEQRFNEAKIKKQ